MTFNYKAKYTITALLMLLLPTIGTSQNLPDSIVITKNTYFDRRWNDTVDGDIFQKAQIISLKKGAGTYISDHYIINDSLITDLLKEINDTDNLRNSLAQYGIDTNWIKKNPDKMFRLSKKAKDMRWNKQQRALILREFLNTHYYETALNEYLNNGCCYSMHQLHKYQYIIKIYRKGALINELTSRRFVWGVRYPWTDAANRKLYSFKIEKILEELLHSEREINPPAKNRRLLKRFADYVVDINWEKLHQLWPYTYEKQINELKPLFKIVSFSEISGYGGYHGDPVIQIRLKAPEMLPNVTLEFLATEDKGTIYSRDSVINSYKSVVNRVQSVKFIREFLATHPDQNLDILYFNNHTINQYNINSVNGNPDDWKKYDADVKSMDWYKQNKIEPSFDTVKALKTSAQIYCGCNYRFRKEYLEKAICFIIDDKAGNHSRWALLPDDTLLLYFMQGEKVLDYNYKEFGDAHLQYPCVRFDDKGKIIPRPNHK
ncbi:MAG: hypothetical protein V4577_21390 [Bacteroidota bacterium]